VSTLWQREVVDGAKCTARVCGLWQPNFGDSRNNLPGRADPLPVWSRAMWWVTTQKNWNPEASMARLPALDQKGYEHEITFPRGTKKTPSELMPRVQSGDLAPQTVADGNPSGRVGHKHLDYYLDEFTFRFNRRDQKAVANSSSALYSKRWRSSLFHLDRILHLEAKAKTKPQSVGET
jgi:hypothetical protein